MFNAKRLAKYLATGSLPEMTALDTALARYSEVMDAIDFAAHDRRYHGGAYDPQTMTCEMRQAFEKGDLADVLAAEEDEEIAWRRYIKKHPELMTDAEFVRFFGKPNQTGKMRIRRYLDKLYKPARQDGGGTKIGEFDGKCVCAHNHMTREMVNSKNAHFKMRYEKDVWRDKILIIRHLSEFLSQAKVNQNPSKDHKSNQHRAWEIAEGFHYGSFNLNGRPWYFVFTGTQDGRLLLYDIIQNEK